MDAMTEGNVRIGVAPDVETVRVGELHRIAIGGADHGKHAPACRNRLAVHFDVARGGPEHKLNGSAEAQHLFDRRR
jgi:hypothetical protein